MSSEHSIAAEVAHNLATTLSDKARITTDASSAEFKELLRRWSDLNIQVPSAIIEPNCEEDIVQIVRQNLFDKGSANEDRSNMPPSTTFPLWQREVDTVLGRQLVLEVGSLTCLCSDISVSTLANRQPRSRQVFSQNRSMKPSPMLAS